MDAFTNLLGALRGLLKPLCRARLRRPYTEGTLHGYTHILDFFPRGLVVLCKAPSTEGTLQTPNPAMERDLLNPYTGIE